MPTLFAAFLTLSSMFAVAPPDLRLVWKPVRPAELNVLEDLLEDLAGVPVPIFDPFQTAITIELHGTF